MANNASYDPLFELMDDDNFTIETIQKCLERGSDINALYNHGVTVLMRAIEFGFDTDIIAFLIEKGANVNQSDNFGTTPLMVSISESEDYETLDLLIENKADLNAKDKLGKTALMRSLKLEYNSDDVMEYLIKKGANIDTKDNQGNSLIFLALEEERIEFVSELLLTNKEYAKKFFDSFPYATLKRPFKSNNGCKAFTLAYGNFQKDKLHQTSFCHKLPCCWPKESEYTHFVGEFIRVFDWSKVTPTKEYEYVGFIRAYFENKASSNELKLTLFLKNYSIYETWKDILNEKYKDIIEKFPEGIWCMFPSDCGYCT
jgi:ankyrin repeat protein